MNALKIAAIGMAVLVASVGVAAAAPGNAPSGTPADDKADTNSTDSSDDETANVTAPESPGAVVEDRGPPTSLPSQVPDFVGEIHDTIRGFMNGAVEDLGSAVSEIAGGDHAETDDDQADSTNTTTTTV